MIDRTNPPLISTVFTNGGLPIKTKLAADFPQLTRRQRRTLLRNMMRSDKKRARLQQVSQG